MTPELYGLLARVHGHLAVLALALLLHPVITLARRPGLPRWTRRTAWLAALLLALPFGIGWAIYPDYRQHVKPRLWQQGHPALLLFETKEHLAAMSVVLAVAGALVLLAAGRTDAARRTSWALLLAAWCCGVGTALLGIYVGAVAQPGW